MWHGSSVRFILRGRRTSWWGSRFTLLAPRIVNDVSYVMRIIDAIHFAWQAQHLVKLEGDSCCFAPCQWRFIRDTDQAWDSFCVAGAVLGEVRGLSCIPPSLSTQDRLENSLSIFTFGILNLTCYFPYDPRWVGRTFFCWRTIAPFFLAAFLFATELWLVKKHVACW